MAYSELGKSLPHQMLEVIKTMSSNNILILNRKELTLTHKDIESDEPYSEVKCKSIKELLDKAMELQDECQPEYGVFIV
jgi:hypothetical protein